MPSAVRVRFAPSPTGYLHIGGARTALFNWLYARHTGGTLVLRIEDTDRARNTEEAARAIYDGLRWLGLDWDEGPQAGGDFGPYFQSEREAVYESYLDKLRAAGRVYEDAGAVRFRFAREKVVVDDIICGQIEFDMSSPETNPDMTIRRPDGSWIFHFVNVVDDTEMKISHVIRGEDHLSNTPKHVQLYRAFGATPPRFAHIPLILNKDGSKMSKRDQGASLNTYIDGGYLPEAVRNYLCLLGWSGGLAGGAPFAGARSLCRRRSSTCRWRCRRTADAAYIAAILPPEAQYRSSPTSPVMSTHAPLQHVRKTPAQPWAAIAANTGGRRGEPGPVGRFA